MARKRRAADVHACGSARQVDISSASARIFACTLRHLTQSTPSGARKANRPNGSSPKAACGPDTASSATTADALVWRTPGAEALAYLFLARASAFARTSLIVKNLAGPFTPAIGATVAVGAARDTDFLVACLAEAASKPAPTRTSARAQA